MPQSAYCLVTKVTSTRGFSTYPQHCGYVSTYSIPVRKAVILMIFLSTLLRKSIFDSEEHRLGILKDICVSLNETFPTVTALIVSPSSLSMGNSDMIIPWSQVEKLETERVHLTVKQSHRLIYAGPGRIAAQAGPAGQA